VGHRARGDREIEEDEVIGEPEGAADRSRVVDRLLDRLEVVGLLGELRKSFRRRGRFGGRRPGSGALYRRRGFALVLRWMLLRVGGRIRISGPVIVHRSKPQTDGETGLF